MTKRLFTAFLTAVMVMSLCVAVTAEETRKGENVFALWGDFESEKYWENIPKKIKFNSSPGVASIADIGADGSGHSLKLDTTRATSDVFWLFRPATPGETYDLSLKVKTDTTLMPMADI